MLLPAITTTDVQEQDPRVAILPIGSYEQHGAHLPLITDTAIACIIAGEIAAAYPVLQLPPITMACSHEHGTWPGTVSISARTLHAVVNDIAASLEASGIRKIVLVNAHGGNYVLSNIVQEANLTEPRMTLFPQGREWNRSRERAASCPMLTATCTRGRLRLRSCFTRNQALYAKDTRMQTTTAENARFS